MKVKTFTIEGQKFLDVYEGVELGLASSLPMIVMNSRVEAYEQHDDDPSTLMQVRAGYTALGVVSLMWRDEKFQARLSKLVMAFLKEHTC